MSSFSYDGLVNLAKQAGFSDRDAHVMGAIALAESSGESLKVNGPNKNGTYDYGLWQINSSHGTVLSHGNWRDPLANAKMAHEVWHMQGFEAWSSFTKQPGQSTPRYWEFFHDPNSLPPGTTAFGNLIGKPDLNPAGAVADKAKEVVDPLKGIPEAITGFGNTLAKIGDNLLSILLIIVLLVLGILLIKEKSIIGAAKSIPKVIPL